MKKIIFGFMVAGAAILSVGISRAATSTCLGNPTTSLSSANGMTTNTLPGCETVDKTFGNFLLGTASVSGTATSSGASLSNLYILGGGSSPNITADVSGTSNQWSAGNPGVASGSVSQELDFLVNVDPADSGGFLLQGVNVGSLDSPNIIGNGLIQITYNICPEAVFSVGCTGEISLSLGSGSGSTTTGGELMFSSGLTNVASVQALLTVTAPTSSDFAGLEGFSLSFDQAAGGSAPEPSTFILLGSALAGIGALRYRKRKQQS
jgi:hypothetical protein